MTPTVHDQVSTRLSSSDGRGKARSHERAARTTAIATLTESMAACTGPHKRLRPVAEVPEVAPRDREGMSLPSELRYLEAGPAGDATLRMAAEELGYGGSDHLVVLVHGLLSNREAWRHLAGDLGCDHDLLLVDLPGCGDSDRPDPGEMGEAGYSPEALARRLLIALRGRLARGDTPERLALVGHSLGGAVVLRMMGSPSLRASFDDVLARVDRVVLVAPMDFAIERIHPDLAEIAELGNFRAFLGRKLGVLKRTVAASARQGMVDPDQATREDARRMMDAIAEADSRRAAQAMIQQAVPYDRANRRPLWDQIERLVADYVNVEAPTLILWGARDETLSAAMGYKLQAQLPDAWLRVIRKTMHSIALERPRLAAEQIRRFLDDGGAGWERIEVLDPEPGRLSIGTERTD